MVQKYTKDEIMDITKTFIQGNDDARFIQSKMYENTPFDLPHNFNLYSKKDDSNHGIVDVKVLERFGTLLLNNNTETNINAYNLILPSVNEVGAYHSVAFMVDTTQKSIWYQDSYGIEMRKELKDFLKQLLPEYKITCFNQIQQNKKLNDSSCYLLAEYNLLDMWYRKNNQPDKIKQYDSIEARTAVWEIVKQIEATPQTSLKRNIKNSKFSKQARELSKKELLICKKNAFRDFKYRLTEEKNYKQIIATAAQNAKNTHLLYLQKKYSENLPTY